MSTNLLLQTLPKLAVQTAKAPTNILQEEKRRWIIRLISYMLWIFILSPWDLAAGTLAMFCCTLVVMEDATYILFYNPN